MRLRQFFVFCELGAQLQMANEATGYASLRLSELLVGIQSQPVPAFAECLDKRLRYSVPCS